MIMSPPLLAPHSVALICLSSLSQVITGVGEDSATHGRQTLEYNSEETSLGGTVMTGSMNTTTPLREEFINEVL